MHTEKDVMVAMGSKSDWPTMFECVKLLSIFGTSYSSFVMSAHRTPWRIADFSKEFGTCYKVIIAGAGGAAHLPGMFASYCPTIPVIGVPVKSSALSGLDSLYSIVQMPSGVPVATMAIGEAGAKNAAILAAQIIAIGNPVVREKLATWRSKQTEEVPIFPIESVRREGGVS